MRRWIRLFIVLVALTFGGVRPAQAGPAYFELGAGVANILNGSALWSTIPTAPGIGLGFNGLIAINFTSIYDLTQLHFGVKAHYSSSFSDTTQYVFWALTPMIRLEFWRFYIGGGVSPLIWAQEGMSFYPNVDFTPGAYGLYAEAGLLWKVVPYFFMGVEGSAFLVNSGGGFGPSPAFQISLQFRFMLWDENREGGGRKVEFDGWRYPFGIEKHYKN